MLVIPSASYSFERLTPEFGSNYAPNLAKTEAGLWMEFSDHENQLKNSPVRINDIDLDGYLKEVLCKLALEYCEDVRVYVIRNPYFNASMAPNGMMQVHTGFLLRVENEAQLASVLGHEIGHFLKRHSIKSMEDTNTKSSFFAFLSLGVVGAVASGNMNADFGRSTLDLSNLILTGSIFSYSRDNEREADKYGIQLLNDAKLDINAAKEIWVNLIEEKKAASEDITAGSYFYATHPDPGERINNLESHAIALNRTSQTSIIKNKETYWEKISPILPIALKDELNLRQFEQTEYLFKKLLNNNVSLGLIHFYLGELYRLKEIEEEEHLIKEHYNKATEYEDYPAEVHRSLGLIDYKARNYPEAKGHFNKYLNMKPDAHDKEMIEFYINTGA